MTDEEAMHMEEIREKLANMKKCLDIASDIILMPEQQLAEQNGNAVIMPSMIDTVIEKHFPVPLVERRRNLIEYVVGLSTVSHGLTSCAVWAIAHSLDHLLYEEDLSQFDHHP